MANVTTKALEEQILYLLDIRKDNCKTTKCCICDRLMDYTNNDTACLDALVFTSAHMCRVWELNLHHNPPQQMWIEVDTNASKQALKNVRSIMVVLFSGREFDMFSVYKRIGHAHTE